MRQLFEHADKDQSGTISRREFRKETKKKEVRYWLESMDLDVDSAQKVGNLIAVDDKSSQIRDELKLEEFTEGVAKIRGNAKTMDITFLRQDVEGLKRDVKGIKELLLRQDMRWRMRQAC